MIAPVLDPSITLLLPDHDTEDPQLSIVVPALNEELTITDFVRWCQEGLASAGVVGEILIVDSSTDRTAELALAGGARVLRTPKRGLGRAYTDALPYVRGDWIVMGDADCTYDFRELAPFVEGFRAGNDYVMGSRWRGSIEAGSMPALHRYAGTPVTTWILNRIYRSNFSDIHCGMRGITRAALERMNLQSQSWEYASEMMLKSVHMELATTEVPVRFLKDREGRVSHHKREGWTSPFKAAWINLRAMFIYGADFFLVKPGLLLTVLGLLLMVPVSLGNIDLGAFGLSIYWQLLGLTLLAIGWQTMLIGGVAQVLFDYTGTKGRRWRRWFPYTRTSLVAFGIGLLGVLLTIPLVHTYFTNDLALERGDSVPAHLAVTGLGLVVMGAQLFVSTLLLHGATIAVTQRRPVFGSPVQP